MRLGFLIRATFFFFLGASGPALSEDVTPAVPSSQDVRDAFDLVSPDWRALPEALVLAVVAAEDPDFYEDFPVGSAISSQVVKAISISGRTAIQQRLLNHRLQWSLANALTHDEILNLYLNRVYLGLGCYGVISAAENHFQKDADELSLGEVAILVSLIKRPQLFGRTASIARLIQNRDVVLGQMMNAGLMSAIEEQQARSDELVLPDAITT